MTCYRSVIAAVLVVACCPAALGAQAVVQPLGQTDADLLATQMRQLTANPQDLNALMTAGELSIKLGDLSGAAALLARADRINPRNGRVKAGMGSILVRSERPGEALRFFAQAESYGWSATRFAADRGLAYDLIGEQARAQRDYRTALAGAPDDETTRRYALSLGISGRQKEAVDLLDPLIRRQDRAGWRARAFVLAMGGDTAGAAKIATIILPSGMAQGLDVFFQKLPTLAPADRAFAVHFGEIAPTPERLADARLTPALAPLRAEPAPVRIAAVTVASRPEARKERKGRKAKPGREPIAPVAIAGASTPPAVVSPRPGVQSATSPLVVAAAPARQAASPSGGQPVQAATVQPRPATVAQPGFSSAALANRPTAAAPVAAMRETDVRVAARPTTLATSAPVVPGATTSAPIVARPAPQPVAIAAAPTRSVPTSTPSEPATQPVARIETASATQRADSVLARIVASLSIPASELGVQQPARVVAAPPRATVPPRVAAAPASAVGRRVVAEAAAKEARDTAVRRTVAAKLTGNADIDDAKPLTRAERRAAERKALAKGGKAEPDAETLASLTPRERRAAQRKALADKKAGKTAPAEEAAPLTRAEKRAAERKLAADKDKKALADKKAARGNPARIWVQVAGGANERDLGKAWSAAKAKAPALAGRAGYSTPLRATNRVLTGPFKTDAEARAFVNKLAKQGVSGFSFTSEAGQEITRLGAK